MGTINLILIKKKYIAKPSTDFDFSHFEEKTSVKISFNKTIFCLTHAFELKKKINKTQIKRF